MSSVTEVFSNDNNAEEGDRDLMRRAVLLAAREVDALTFTPAERARLRQIGREMGDEAAPGEDREQPMFALRVDGQLMLNVAVVDPGVDLSRFDVWTGIVLREDHTHDVVQEVSSALSSIAALVGACITRRAKAKSSDAGMEEVNSEAD